MIERIQPENASASYAPGSRINFKIPPSLGVLDLSQANLVGYVNPTNITGASVPELYLPDGAVDTIAECRVMTGSGMTLEELQGVNVLASTKNAFLGSDATDAARARTELVGQPLIKKETTLGDDSELQFRPFSMPLSRTSLGMFSVDSYPASATDGLRIEMTLDAVNIPFEQKMVNQPYACENLASANSGNVQLTEVIHHDYLHVGQAVTIAYADGGTDYYESRVIGDIDYSSKTALVVFTAALTNPAGSSGVTIQSDEIRPTATAPSATTLDFPEISLENSPFYTKQAIRILSIDGTPDVIQADVEITGVAVQGSGIRVTFAPALAGTAPFNDIRVSGIPQIAGLQWNLTEVYLEVPSSPPTAEMQKMLSRSMIQFPLRSVSNQRELVIPSLQNELALHTDSLSACYAIMSVPTDATGTSGAFSRLRGVRDDFVRYQWLVDGQSAPLQPVDIVVSNPPYHYSLIADAFRQGLDQGISRLTSSAMLFPKALSKYGQLSDLTRKRVALRFARDSTATAIQLMMNHFSIQEKTISIGAKVGPSMVQIE